MYFSKHDHNISYINHYGGLLEVKGEGVLVREDADVYPEPNKRLAEEYHTLSVLEGITGIGEGYLDEFLGIKCLILSRTVESVAASSELLDSMRTGKVLIRGEYDSFAESFAVANCLDFLHSDIEVGGYHDEAHGESTYITLRFCEDGSSDILYNCFSTGISGGSMGGGEYAHKLPDGYFSGCTLEQFAGEFSERMHEQILGNEALGRFFDSLKRRK